LFVMRYVTTSRSVPRPARHSMSHSRASEPVDWSATASICPGGFYRTAYFVDKILRGTRLRLAGRVPEQRSAPPIQMNTTTRLKTRSIGLRVSWSMPIRLSEAALGKKAILPRVPCDSSLVSSLPLFNAKQVIQFRPCPSCGKHMQTISKSDVYECKECRVFVTEPD
jgi:hypothetical protein